MDRKLFSIMQTTYKHFEKGIEAIQEEYKYFYLYREIVAYVLRVLPESRIENGIS